MYRQADATAAHLGLLWAARHGHGHAQAWLGAALEGYWSGALDPADRAAVAEAMAASGVPVEGFAAWAQAAGPAALAGLRDDLQAAGVFQVPTYLLGEEPFQGMAHLPLLRALLGP
jgi:2-hydroxychromene-2-carboxylate isomerase